ncbi:MAG: GNAT family N-acetyltransferase [bacterium]
MKAITLRTADPNLILIEPNIERDAVNGVKWLEGDQGVATLLKMGVPKSDIEPTSIEAERQRVNEFLTKPDELNWMIEYKGQVVGSIWADLKPTKYIPSPTVAIMIGDPAARGQGIGFKALEAVKSYFKNIGETKVYARYLTGNDASRQLTTRSGFVKEGDTYMDQDDLEWQNVVLAL